MCYHLHSGIGLVLPQGPGIDIRLGAAGSAVNSGCAGVGVREAAGWGAFPPGGDGMLDELREKAVEVKQKVEQVRGYL